jgi:hypothetical protein
MRVRPLRTRREECACNPATRAFWVGILVPAVARHARGAPAAEPAGRTHEVTQEPEEPREGDRLLTDPELGIPGQQLSVHSGGVGRHERDPQLGLDLAGPVRQFATIHDRHHQVRNQESDLIGVLLEIAERVPAILRRLDRVAHVAAYAFAELFGWQQGIDEHFSRAPAFYMVVGTAITAGVALDFANVNPVKALYWTAIINGLLAPFLLTGILLVASDRTLMQKQPSSRLSLVTVGVTTALMFAAAVAMFVV